MHDIEPFYLWLDRYVANEDELSVFYGREYNEFECTNTIYNYYIHPQWDDIGSQTLYVKVLYADYKLGYAVIELIGEWNDCLYNDIMFMKRNLIESMIENNISKFILIGENVLNFHSSDDCYYQEWFDDISDGWIAAINFRTHVLKEFETANLGYYLAYGGELNHLNWRTYTPEMLFNKINSLMIKRLTA